MSICLSCRLSNRPALRFDVSGSSVLLPSTELLICQKPLLSDMLETWSQASRCEKSLASDLSAGSFFSSIRDDSRLATEYSTPSSWMGTSSESKKPDRYPVAVQCVAMIYNHGQLSPWDDPTSRRTAETRGGSRDRDIVAR